MQNHSERSFYFVCVSACRLLVFAVGDSVKMIKKSLFNLFSFLWMGFLWWLAATNFLVEGVAGPYVLFFESDEVSPSLHSLAKVALRSYGVLMLLCALLFVRSPYSFENVSLWSAYHSFCTLNIVVAGGKPLHLIVHVLFAVACLIGVRKHY